MPSFVPFVPATGVVRGTPDVTAALSDPPRKPTDLIIRTGVARHAGATVAWLPLSKENQSPFALLAPVTGTCRQVPVSQLLQGVTTILELSPLPFAIAPVLRKLPGFPTFYLAPVTTTPLPDADQVISAGSVLAHVDTAFVGMLFDDRVTLSPAAWVEQIALAMTGVDDEAAITTWRGLNRFAPTSRALQVLDHVGRPMSGAQIEVNSVAGTSTATTNAFGTLPLPDGDLELTWQQASQPVHALYERGLAALADRSTSTPPGSALSVPAAVTTGHLQVLDAASWFADRPDQLDPGLGHIHPDSRLEPLVDGVAFVGALLTDLRAATGPGEGAHFAGWAFDDFPLDLANPDETMLADVIQSLRGGEGARFLMDKVLVFRPDAPIDPLKRLAVLLLAAGADVAYVASIVKKLKTDDAGFLAPVILVLLAALATEILAEPLLTLLEESQDHSTGMAGRVNEIHPGIGLRARHPARFVDNPLMVTNPLPFDPANFIDSTASWHQKFQVVRRAAGDGHEVVGYLGGMDLLPNRLDTPGHHGQAWRRPDDVSNTPLVEPYHDVHARVTGPAAADIARSFARRWAFDSGRQPPGTPLLDLAFATPDPTDAAEVPPQPARHLVQVGRTGYRPAAGGGSTPLPWSPDGEATIPQAMIRAIEQAREYIYIEDQYFTPHDDYIRALLAAATRTPRLRLVILSPITSDQVVGNVRRREMFERLRVGWGDRMIAGALVRRPVLRDAGRVASNGRLYLRQPLGAAGGDTQATLGPRSRLPKDLPFWLWVEGERMLAVDKIADVDVDGVPSRTYLVRRSSSSEPLWGARPRAHAVDAPVTLARTTGITLHTKAIIVDDVFVVIGSSNVNRRGFFHDGEIAAFTVPERLKADRENPALNLRTVLWAEHLGLPPAMGRSLLADPIAAFELFRRTDIAGNRLSPFDALGVTPELGFPSEAVGWIKQLAVFGLTVAEADVLPYVWNVFADPTTDTDPNPTPGPGLGSV